MSAPVVLGVEDLGVVFDTEAGPVRAVDGVSWSVRAGETLAIVGESGSGKSVSALAVMGLVPSPPGRVDSGTVQLEGSDLLSARPGELRSARGRRISMVFQDPLTSLNPVMAVGRQVAEVIVAHGTAGKLVARRRAVELLDEVGVPQPDLVARQYPHQLSGGMRQRALIAMAIALDPAVIIADEPTTALDVTVQAQIMDLLARLRSQRGMALVLITHDLGLVAGAADRVCVMYAGRVMEQAAVDDLFYRPRHGYTRGLLASLIALEGARSERSGRFEPIPGQPPSLLSLPTGCAFNPRCEFVADVCRDERPRLAVQPDAGPGHVAACHRAAAVAAAPAVVAPPPA